MIAFVILIFFSEQHKKHILDKYKIQKLQNIHQIEMLNAAIQGQEDERKNISAYLHDHVSNSLFNIKLEIDVFVNRFTKKLTKEENNNLIELSDLVKGIQKDIRNLSHDLMPDFISNFGLIKTLKAYCENYKHKNNINFLDNCNEPDIEMNHKLAIYRIFCELISNSIQHAKASCIIADCKITSCLFKLRVYDNGIGIDFFKLKKLKIKDNKRHAGILNIQNRIRYLNADFEFKTGKNRKTLVIVTYPLNSA